jgi:hypothetical protein
MKALLEPAMLLGLGAVAVWTHVNHPKLRPGSLVLAALHVAFSFCAFALLPLTLSFLLPALPTHVLQPYVVLGLLIATLTYLLLSWVWLLARILHDLFGGPRGGHPVANES